MNSRADDDRSRRELWRLLDSLRAALALIKDRDRWLADDDSDWCIAKDKAGRRCAAISAQAVAFTWRGAVFRVLPDMQRRQLLFEALDRADQRVAHIPVGRGYILSHDEIVLAFEGAIAEQERLRQRGD